ncbi:hypothetical protein [Chryseobacterium vrystaatense]|uniref:Uncharacterized protein n=1 Tax=Chryseobacterium vrystaatense TaxID=307480 RepID=A0A1M5HAI1_9FLAO|nr:hypothetical protein [Chryseobacterium vrystaatense]SHG12957.1 hypothetical protein SAMN02787073_3635 [Chryseobacterium vrystaatense]
MKTIILSIFIFGGVWLKSQTFLTKDYSIYSFIEESSSNRDFTYAWIKNSDNSYYMNFAYSEYGLQNAIDKARYILSLSNINEVTYDSSEIPSYFKSPYNLKVFHKLIINDKASLKELYTIDDKVMLVSCSHKGYYIIISDKDNN